VLGNVKLPAENEAHIEPFLERLKQTFGIPLALVHDMGKGILAAVDTVFPGVPDYICHFHFLRDIGKDYLGTEYDTIRKRLSAHGIRATLRYRAKHLKREMDANPAMIAALHNGMQSVALPAEDFAFTPVVGAYTLIQWALSAKAEGDGYGFPFDHPHHRKACHSIPGLADPSQGLSTGSCRPQNDRPNRQILEKTLCRSNYRPDCLRAAPDPTATHQQHPRTVLS
jgi:hypothetical protein